ncbi:hypothetical protein EDC04DRAFT_2890116 [Pisolithus marmoratus]|nr:hypothetical protein EDC04DRAFT_2890116 [Pisolithus marmoratus]
MSNAHLEAQEREMNIMCNMMEDMHTYILSPPPLWLSPPPLWFSHPLPLALPPPTNILLIPEPVLWSTPLTIATAAQDYLMDTNRLSSDIQPTDVCTVVEPISEDTQGDND